MFINIKSILWMCLILIVIYVLYKVKVGKSLLVRGFFFGKVSLFCYFLMMFILLFSYNISEFFCIKWFKIEVDKNGKDLKEIIVFVV